MQFHSQHLARESYQFVAELKKESELKQNAEVKSDNEQPLNIEQAESLESRYRSLALKMPTMIMQSGLMQAIGFLKAKAADGNGDCSKRNVHYPLYLHHLTKLLAYAPNELHDELVKSSVTEYMRLTRRALAASSWLKRYAEALLKSQGDQ